MTINAPAGRDRWSGLAVPIGRRGDGAQHSWCPHLGEQAGTQIVELARKYLGQENHRSWSDL
jgi:hypothetical protein